MGLEMEAEVQSTRTPAVLQVPGNEVGGLEPCDRVAVRGS